MDKLVIPAFRIQSIPAQSNEQNTREEVLRLLRTVENNLVEDRIHVQVFHTTRRNGDRDHFAIVTGSRALWGQIKAAFNHNAVINGRPFGLSTDFGMPRRLDNGEFVNPLSGTAMLFFQDMFMCPRDWMPQLWDRRLYTDAERRNQTNYVKFANVDPDYNRDMMHDVGRVVSWKYNQKKKELLVDYSTLIEKLQAISRLSLNVAFSPNARIPGIHMNTQHGLAQDQGNVQVHQFELNRGFIPFENLDRRLIPKVTFAHYNRSCYKCDEVGTFKAVGITSCGLFIAAVCSHCNYYGDNLNPLALNVAVTGFDGERFTRVRLGRNDFGLWDNRPQAFVVAHRPLQFKYESPEQARKIIGILDGHESWCNKRSFGIANAADGVILEQHLIELLEAEDANRENPAKGSSYRLNVRVPRRGIWLPDNIVKIMHITVTCNGRRPDWHASENITRRAKIIAMEEMGENHIQLKLRIKAFHNFVFNQRVPQGRAGNMAMSPVPPDYDHEKLLRVLSDWNNHPNDPKYEFMTRLLINQQNFFLAQNQLPNNAYNCEWLNPEQQAAIDLCRTMRMVCVQGPPGTGKTKTAASFIVKAATEEEGLFIAVAKSNFAADNLALGIEKIKSLHPELFGHLEVVRLASIRREQSFVRMLPDADVMFHENDAVVYLHDLVIRHQDFWHDSDPQRQEFLDKLIGPEAMDDLTEAELKFVNRHFNRSCYKILNETKIVVTTLATLFDSRVEKLLLFGGEDDGGDNEDVREKKEPIASSSQSPQKRLFVNTILLDEAGVTPMTNVIPLLVFEPKRFLLFGDPEQLPPQINSEAGLQACLAMSPMMFIRYGIKPNNLQVWQTLLRQYRMSPGICHVVNHMTYNNLLKNSHEVMRRKNLRTVKELKAKVRAAIPETRNSSVVVFNHTGEEQPQESGSFRNAQEADIVIKVVTALLRERVASDDITIITFYDGQRQLLLDQLRVNQLTRNIQVSSIDGFQGKENNVIILSFVRGNNNGDIGFCKVANRLNVAISRARFFEIIVANMGTFLHRAENHIARFAECIHNVPWRNIN